MRAKRNTVREKKYMLKTEVDAIQSVDDLIRMENDPMKCEVLMNIRKLVCRLWYQSQKYQPRQDQMKD